MKVSIITVCLNSAQTIEKALASLNTQDYPDIEHIVKDGASTDETLELISSISPQSIVKSDKDQGLYYALNQAIDMTTGEVVGILHADDFFSDSHVISDVVRLFQMNHCDAVYGDLIYVDRKDLLKVKRRWKAGEYKEGDFLKGWMPPHPTFFVKKSIIQKYGRYNTDFKTAADYEWMLRLIHKVQIKLAYLPRTLVSMRTGGQSNASLWKRIMANREDRRAWKVNGLYAGWFTLMLKPLRKLIQFIR